MRARPALLAVGLFACVGAPTGGGPARPNVVLMMADDLGWGDVGFNGNRVIDTRHLDALAATGMRFTRFYAQSPVCSPTRGSCLTGRHPYRYGIFGANVGHLPASEVNLAELLAAEGYATGHFGKWHLGTLRDDYSGKSGRDPGENHRDPGMAGFERWFSTEYAVATFDPYDPERAHGAYDVRNLYWSDGANVADGLSGDDSRILMDPALEFIRAAHGDGRPFLAVIWFHAPHEPVFAGPEHRARYAGRTADEQHYFGCITAMDEQVGRLVGLLDELGARDDTLIAFCSDNGPEGTNGPRGRSRGSAGPFRGRKRSLYEGGVRVPAFFVWPGRIPAGASTDFPASTSDYVPTLLDQLGIRRVGREPLDGVSLRDVLAGREVERAQPIAFQTRGQRVLSGARFKLVHDVEAGDEGWELYDLLEDRGETRNVIGRHPDVAGGMRAELERFLASCEASLATLE